MTAIAQPTHKLRKLWLAIGWLLVALVTYLSLTPDPPVVTDNRFANDIAYTIFHLLTYAVLMLWFVQLYAFSRWLVIALSLIVMGSVLEVLQGFTPVRVADFVDIVANGTGVLLGWLLAKTRLSRTLLDVERVFIYPSP